MIRDYNTVICLVVNVAEDKTIVFYAMLLVIYLLLLCRDVIEVRMDLGGVPCIISDTAGLRSHSDDVIEIEGMKRAR